MKYLKLFESYNKEDIDSIRFQLNIFNIVNYTINEDGSIDVNDDVDLDNEYLIKIPIRFRNVTGDFYCSNNHLTSLEGGPQSVGGDFYCNNNQLTSLKGCPISVGGNFYCGNNHLTSLEGAPQEVGGYFYFHNNPCSSIYEEWIGTDRRDELLDMMKDYDFLRGDKITGIYWNPSSRMLD